MNKYICLISLFLFIAVTGCTNKYAVKRIEVNNDSCYVEREINTHGGFLGDGEYFARITCSNLDANQLSNNWRKLPLTDSINQIMNLIMCDNNECKNPLSRYEIPDIVDGYYLFVDRHSESVNKHDDEDINNRSSYNFNLALCDINNNTIYYYELDT